MSVPIRRSSFLINNLWPFWKLQNCLISLSFRVSVWLKKAEKLSTFQLKSMLLHNFMSTNGEITRKIRYFLVLLQSIRCNTFKEAHISSQQIQWVKSQPTIIAMVRLLTLSDYVILPWRRFWSLGANLQSAVKIIAIYVV